ncbi:hypothetical protein niasHS_017134 [Heterodera schachtii]|uniref:Uncharacterized protein n=1 Tax=Heterodera schachtii TaxID=97005 RepID=A0ABD2I069_HETSC
MRSFFFVSLALVLIICASTTVSKPHPKPAPTVESNGNGCYKVCILFVCIEICHPKAMNDGNGAALKWRLNISVPISDSISQPSFNLTNIAKSE